MKQLETIEVTLDQLDPDPDNARKKYRGIEGLADTIAEHGLLENLVIIEHPAENDRYIVKAGNRRYLAMKSLLARGVWDPKTPIHCKVVERGVLEALIENGQRDDVPVWDTGAKYCDLAEEGMSQEQIAKTVGKSQQHVSMCVRIARGLSPKLKPALARLQTAGPNVLELAQIAGHVDRDTLEPDHDKQMATLERLLDKPKRQAGKPRGKTVRARLVAARLQELKTLTFTSDAAPIVEAVRRYLSGTDKEFDPTWLQASTPSPPHRAGRRSRSTGSKHPRPGRGSSSLPSDAN